jgi:negative regulator of genetic competence, sporulation and motility
MTKLFTKEGDDYKEVDAFLQPEVDDIVTKRLERERGKFADYDTLKEKAAKVDTISSEWETKLNEATEKATDLEKQVGAAKLEVDKVKIVHEFKLPEDLAEFVTGDTAEVMRTKAEKLAKGVKPGSVDLDKKPKPSDTKGGDSKKMAGKLFGPKAD